MMNTAQIDEFFARLSRANPHPTTELLYDTPYQLLVAVVLSAQATDKSVNIATRKLFARAPTPETMAELSEAEIADHIKTIGLYRNKSRHVVGLTQQLLERYQGNVPDQREQLEALPGVGRKTANVILNTVFQQPVIAVDTHIFRVANRTGMAPGKDVLAVEKKLSRNIPAYWQRHAHHWLILHGRYTCIARKPKCEQCPVYDLCDAVTGQVPGTP